MTYHIIIWLLLVILIPTSWVVKERKNKKINILIGILMAFIFIGPLLPRQLWGKWNAISKIEGKNISEILLQPSEPNWKVNLTGKDFIISNKEEVDAIITLLQKSEVHFPRHQSRIWETKMIFITPQKDSFEIKINQTENNGTVIYTPTNEWRKDSIGKYLTRLINFKKAVYSDTSTSKF